MLDEHQNILYVGKAKSLKNRVSNYTRIEPHTTRIKRMISSTRSMEFIETKTETEALLLEANLIKKHKPPFNVLLRDDKMFPYIMLTGDHDFPLLTKHRGAQTKAHDYYGPFASAGAVNKTLIALQKAFLLRNCSDSVFSNRTRPCLQYQIKRCTAPCVNFVSKEEYAAQVAQAKDFLSGKSSEIQQNLAARMQTASDKMDFEEAAKLRDRIRALSSIQSSQDINVTSIGDADVMAVHQQGGKTCVQVFFFRAGSNYGNRAFFPTHEKDMDIEDILSPFIAQFYQSKPIPKEIYISHLPREQELLEDALTAQSGRKVTLMQPQRGDKKRLIDMALLNAKHALVRKLTETASHEELMESMMDVFDLSDIPQRIEIYDNSHISGTNQVGAMVVVGEEGFLKNQYRKYNIKGDSEAGDDYAMMREVFTRRFKRALTEDPDRQSGTWPDLILVDGGKGQVSAAMDALTELGITDLPLYGVSKGPDRNAGREKFHHPDGRVFDLPHNHPSLYFIQRLRDESHRFAIGSHRAKRNKATFTSPLDEIAGIGPKRKKALLMHFGSAKAVSNARIEDLIKIEGISEATALDIYNHFHS